MKLLETNSPLYVRRLARQVDAAFVRGSYYEGHKIYRATLVLLPTGPCIKITHSEGSTGVRPAQFDQFVDGNGQQISASRGAR